MFQRTVRLLAFFSLLCAGAGTSVAGSLSGSVSTSTSNTTISSYGSLDWIVYGSGGSLPGAVRKNTATPLSITYSPIGSGTPIVETDGIRRFSWSSGSPVSSASNYRNVVSVSGVNNGIRLTVPADAQSRQVRVFFDMKSAGATFRASLSDGSAAPYVNTISTGNSGRQYTISYRADGPGRTLTLELTQTSGSGSVRLAGVAAPNFTYVNHPPTISAPSSLSAQVGQSSSVALVGSDPNGDTITFSATGLPPGLSISTSTGVVSGVPTTEGAFPAVVTVADAAGLTAQTNITFNVGPGTLNTAPTAASGSFSTVFATATTFTPTWTDPDSGDSWTVSILSQPSNGTATASGTQITYTPNPGYVGPDAFTFRVSDSYNAFTDGSASGIVNSVVPAVVALPSATQGTQLGAVLVAWSASANATTYDVLRATSPSDPSPVVLANTAALSYSDTSAAPSVQYWYSVRARNAGDAAAPSTASMGFADTAPSGASASFAATLETALQISPTFTDPDPGDTATFAIVSQPANGTATVVANLITYTPNPGFVGPDSFTFSVTDRAGAFTVGTASGTVTALEPAQVVSVSATQGTLVGGVSLNWVAAANARSYRILRGTSATDPSPVALGTVASLSFSDNTAAPGVPYFYSVQSLTIGQQAAPSSPAMGFADTPPSAASASFTTAVNTPINFAPSFVDPDPGDVAVLTITVPPLRGTVAVIGGSFRYTPDVDYSGPDSFQFTVTDRAGASVTGTAAGSVFTPVPDPISGFTSSLGTFLNSVELSWNVSANATTYRIFRSTSASDPAPTQIGVVSGTTFSNSSLSPGQGFFYFVQPYNLAQPGERSAGLYGFADTPPTSAAATFLTAESHSVTFLPTWVDPDVGDTHTIAIVAQPSHGLASVVSNQLVYTPLPGYVGNDVFSFSVTDRAGGSVTGFATGVVEPGVPDKPLGFVVSQGTLLGGVNLTWDVAPGSRQYLVTRSEVRNATTAPVIATVDTNAFVDTNTTPGLKYFYRIRGVGVAGIGPYSEEVSGYADTPPTSATASASTIFNIPVDFAPTVVDPDPNDAHSLAIVTQPPNGLLTLTNDAKGFRYVPNVGYSGVDSFSFTATDVAGASVSGTGSIAVGCPTPTVSALAVSQPKIFANSGFTVSAAYGNTACPVALRASFEVLNGTTVVNSQANNTLTGAVSAPVAFPVDGLQPGTYTLRLTVTDSVTLQSRVSTMPLSVPAYRMPSFTATAIAFADLDSATIAVGRSDDCTLTANRSAAIADHTLCYYEVTNVPPGVIFDSAQTFPTWMGRPTTPGTYSPTLTVYQYDDAGTARPLGQTVRSTVVNPITSLTFSSPATIDASQYVQLISLNVSQTSGPSCPLLTDRDLALQRTLQGNRSCFVEYSPRPPRSTLTPTGLSAYFLEAGTTNIGWQVSTFDTAGTEIRFANGSTDVNVRPVDVNFVLSWGDRNPIATVTKASVRLVNEGSDRCSATVSESSANVPAADKPCLIEWLSLPPGITQDPGTQNALLTGIFTTVGQIPIGYRVSYFDVEGNKRVLAESTKSVTVDAPPLPQFVMKTSRPIGGDNYVVPDTGGLLGILVTDVGGWPVDAIVKWSDQSAATTYRINKNTGLQILSATPAPLWSTRQVDVRLQLRDAVDLYTDKTITVHSVPPDSVKLGLDVLPADVPDSTNFPVTARVEMMGRTGMYYDAALMGAWAVQFGFKDASSQFIPAGEPVPIDADGIARSTLNPFGQTLVRVQAVAVPITTLTGYTRKLDSPIRVASVVKGTPIDGTIGMFRGAAEGPSPFPAVIRVTFRTRGDQLANESVKWKASSDGGTTWIDVEEDGPQITQRLNEGEYQYKAIFINRNTRVVSESNVLTLRSWSIPQISLTGDAFAFPGSQTSVTIGLTSPSGSALSASAVTEWSVNRRVTVAPGASPPPPVASGTGTSVTFTGAEPGTYILTVRARMAASNPDDPRAWSQAIKTIVYGPPEAPLARIIGPARVEVGKPVTYQLLLRTRFDLSNSSLRLGGRWVLPDGSSVPSLDPYTYSATDADFAAGKFVTLKYEVWVVGYESSTLTTATLSLPLWKYVWPSWSLRQSVVVPYAPTNSRITVVPSDVSLLGVLEGLTYQWTVPPTMRALAVPTSKLDTVIDFGGTHAVSVLISDARGNSTTLDTSITVGPAAPYVITYVPSNMSSWSHAPLTVGLNPKVSGGHPLDAVTTWSYFLNGNRVDLPNRNSAQIPIATPGTHTVEVRIASRMGATATQSASVTIPSNIPATCDVTASTNAGKTAVYLKTNCIDPDGSITRYQWAVNGVVQTLVSASKWTYLVPAGTPWPIRFDLTVTDTGGASTTSGATVN